MRQNFNRCLLFFLLVFVSATRAKADPKSQLQDGFFEPNTTSNDFFKERAQPTSQEEPTKKDEKKLPVQPSPAPVAVAPKAAPTAQEIMEQASDAVARTQKIIADKELTKSKTAVTKPIAPPVALSQPPSSATTRPLNAPDISELRKAVKSLKTDSPQQAHSPETQVSAWGVSTSSSSPGAPQVSLVMNAQPVEKLISTLQSLKDLNERKQVRVGEILIVGRDQVVTKELTTVKSLLGVGAFPVPRNALEYKKIVKEVAEKQAAHPAPDTKEILAMQVFTRQIPLQFGLHAVETVSAAEIIEHLGVTSSPSWIIRSEGVDYIFSGRESVSQLFTAQGVFLVPSDESAAVRADARRSLGSVSLSDDEVPASVFSDQKGIPLMVGNPDTETVFEMGRE